MTLSCSLKPPKVCSNSALAKAKARLQKGKTVFLHKIIYVPGDELFMKEDIAPDSYNVLPLDQPGLEGWEVVNIVPPPAPARRGANTLGA